MARIRTIKPEIWSDEKFVELSMPARLLFIGTLNFADDNGVLEHSIPRLKMQVFPNDAIDCAPLVAELLALGLLSEYTIEGQRLLRINGFARHQRINRPSKPRFPLAANGNGSLTESSLNTHGNINEESITTHRVLTEGSLTEKEKEKEKEGSKPKNKAPAVPFVLPDWVPRDAWDGFIAMRRAQHKPPTLHAKELLVALLDRLRADGDDPRTVLERSTMNSWASLFPLVRAGPARPQKFDPVAHVNRPRAA